MFKTIILLTDDIKQEICLDNDDCDEGYADHDDEDSNEDGDNNNGNDKCST